MEPITKLRDETRTMLLNRPVSLSIKHLASILNVSESWLNMFARGKIEHPSVVTIESLNTYLKKVRKKVN